MPRIKKPKHPPLPTKFRCPNALPYIPPKFGFELGEYVTNKFFEAPIKGWVCGSDTLHNESKESVHNQRNQLIILIDGNSEYKHSEVNGPNTYTGRFESWRKIENT